VFRFLILSIVTGVAGALIAERKGRNTALWGALCFLFPILVLLVLVLPSTVSRGRTKKCPYCAEIIKEEAQVCKHCGRELPIEMVECPGCGKYVPRGENCPECGHSLPR
jgi:predicted amidophosphoribosyltransferase